MLSTKVVFKEEKGFFLLFNLFGNCLFRQFLDIPCADKILLVQMDFGDSASANLLASARYVVHFLTYND